MRLASCGAMLARAWVFSIVSMVASEALAQGPTGPFAHVMEPPSGGTSLVLGGLGGATLAPFDPGDPRTGIGLGAAYAPSPLLLFDRLLEDAFPSRAFTIFEMISGLLGAVVSGFSLADAIVRAEGADLSFNAIAAAHAMGCNLELATRAVLHLLLGTDEGPDFEAWMPTVMAFPVAGGAGVSPRWRW